jgi:hypothetical protein
MNNNMNNNSGTGTGHGPAALVSPTVNRGNVNRGRQIAEAKQEAEDEAAAQAARAEDDASAARARKKEEKKKRKLANRELRHSKTCQNQRTGYRQGAVLRVPLPGVIVPHIPQIPAEYHIIGRNQPREALPDGHQLQFHFQSAEELTAWYFEPNPACENHPPESPVLTDVQCRQHAQQHYENHQWGATMRVTEKCPEIDIVLESKFRFAAEDYVHHPVVEAGHKLAHHAVYQYQRRTMALQNGGCNLRYASKSALRFYHYVMSQVYMDQNQFDGKYFGDSSHGRYKHWKKCIAAYIIYAMGVDKTTKVGRDVKLSNYKQQRPEFYWCYIVPTALTMVVLMDNEPNSNLTLTEILNVNIGNWHRGIHQCIKKKGVWSPEFVADALRSPSEADPNITRRTTAGVHYVIAKILYFISDARPIMHGLTRQMAYVTNEQYADLYDSVDKYIKVLYPPRVG